MVSFMVSIDDMGKVLAGWAKIFISTHGMIIVDSTVALKCCDYNQIIEVFVLAFSFIVGSRQYEWHHIPDRLIHLL